MYVVESTFQLETKGFTSKLNALINLLDKAEKRWQSFEALLAKSAASMNAMALSAEKLGLALAPANAELGTMNRRLNATEQGGSKAAAGLSLARQGMIDFGAVATTTNIELEQTALRLAEIKASSKINLSMRGGGIGGVGGPRGGGGAHSGNWVMETINAIMTGEMIEQIVQPAFKPALEFNRQQNRLANSAATAADQKAMSRTAEDVAVKFPLTTPAQNLEGQGEMFAVSRSAQWTMKLAPTMAKMETVFNAIAEKNPGFAEENKGISKDFARIAEFMGKVPKNENDVKGFQSEVHLADTLTRIIKNEGGLVTLSQLAQGVQNMRGGRVGKSDDALADFAFLMSEFKQKTGFLYSQMNRLTSSGVMTKSTAQNWQEMGWLPKTDKAGRPITHLDTNTIKTLVSEEFVAHKEMISDPVGAMKHVLMPLTFKLWHEKGFLKGATTDAQFKEWNDMSDVDRKSLTGKAMKGVNVNAEDFFTTLFMRMPQFENTRTSFHKQTNLDESVKIAGQGADTQINMIGKQFQTLGSTILTTKSIVSGLNGVLGATVGALKDLNEVALKFKRVMDVVDNFMKPKVATPITKQVTKGLEDLLLPKDKLMRNLVKTYTPLGMIVDSVKNASDFVESKANSKTAQKFTHALLNHPQHKMFLSGNTNAQVAQMDRGFQNLSQMLFPHRTSAAAVHVNNHITINGDHADHEKIAMAAEEGAKRGTQKALAVHQRSQTRATMAHVNTVSRADNHAMPTSRVPGGAG